MVENINIEYKSQYTDNILKTVIAFANTYGGQLYIGKDDHGEIVGVKDIDETILTITNSLRDLIKPDITMFTDIYIENKVIVIEVQRGTSRPYYLSQKGMKPSGVYVRQGASSVPASENAIKKMIKESDGDSYENLRSLNQDLSFDYTSDYFQKHKIDFELPQQKSLHLLNKDNEYTNLALLLSDQCLHTIKCAVFQGDTKLNFIDRFEFKGSLLQQLDECYQLINRYNRTKSEFKGLERIDNRDIPEEAIREALLNAIVHREYGLSGSTLVSIFDDRLEIVSLGGLPSGIEYDDILLGISLPRNQNLANIFYRLHLIEAYGTGILKIKDSYLDALVQPSIEITQNAFKLTLPRLTTLDDKELSNPEENIYQYIQETGRTSRKDIDKNCQSPLSSTIRILKSLQQKGFIVKEGNGRNTIYTIKKR